MTTARTFASLGAITLAGVAATGCRAKQLGAQISSTRAASVDASWVTAARNCWPAFSDSNDRSVGASLLDPIGFRAAFPGYAELPDSQLEAIVAAPASNAPAPATNVMRANSEPILTRAQALQPGLKLDRNSPDAHFAPNLPEDAFCAVHGGTPVGFK